MTLFHKLQDNNRLNVLFKSNTDIVEIFISFISLVFGLTILTTPVLMETVIMVSSNRILPLYIIALGSVFQGLLQFFAWYENITFLRRFLSFLGGVIWLLLAVFEINQHIFIMLYGGGLILLGRSVLNFWIFLRLGLTTHDRHNKFPSE